MYSLIVESLETGEEIARYPREGGALLSLDEAKAILPKLPAGSATTAWQWKWTLQGWQPERPTLAPFSDWVFTNEHR